MHNLLLSIKKRLVLITAILLLCFSLFFAYTMFLSMGYFNFNKQTIVGTIYVENIEESQYASFITSEINDWKNKSTFKVNYQEYSLDIDLSYFELDVDSTISSIQRGQSNRVVFNISNTSKAALLAEFTDVFSEDILITFVYDDFIETINDHLEVMNIFKTYRLEEFLGENVPMTIIDSVTISNIDLADVDKITSTLTELVIDSDSRFSLLTKTEENDFTNNQLSIIASGIQKITLNTPFNGYIFEHNIIVPSWSTEGLNVRILKTNEYDFSFYNPLDFAYTINISKVTDNSISLELVGYPFSTEYTVAVVEESILEYETLYYENDLLDATTVNVIITDTVDDTIYHLLEQAGVNGKILAFTRTSTKTDSTFTTEILYRETYASVPEVFQENIVPKDGE